MLLRCRWVQSAGELPVTWQSILVVARARNHRNRLASPLRRMSCLSRPGPAAIPLTPFSGNHVGIDVGICWEHGNRTGFPHARPRADMPASLRPMLLGCFDSGCSRTAWLGSAESFQTRPLPPARTGNWTISVVNRRLRCRRPCMCLGIRTDSDA